MILSKETRENLIIILLVLILFCLVFLFNYCKSNFIDYKIDTVMTDDVNNSYLVAGEGNLVKSKIKFDDSGVKYYMQNFDKDFYPYYQLLNSNEANLYNQIYANVVRYSDTFVPGVSVNVDEARNAIEAVYFDHPEFFWLDSKYTYKYLEDGKVVQIKLNFNSTVDNIAEAKRYFDREIDKIVKNASLLNDSYKQEKYVHDVLVDKINYDLNASDNQSAYSALVNGRTVCAGYARAFQYIMIKLGIPTYYVTGISNGESHAWNIVKIDNNYYNVDLTWNDSLNSYRFYNVSDSLMIRTHTRKGLSVYLPSC